MNEDKENKRVNKYRWFFSVIAHEHAQRFVEHMYNTDPLAAHDSAKHREYIRWQSNTTENIRTSEYIYLDNSCSAVKCRGRLAVHRSELIFSAMRLYQGRVFDSD